MFAKLARLHILGYGRRQPSIQMAAPCNDNGPVRRLNLAARLPRCVLASRWHRTTAGRLECTWHFEAPKAPAEEPGISRLLFAA